ncbi:dihydrofolate reductase [Ostreibacterium oceani]|uniref:Dihydrofolate reductase n=1 Tax=Ostreibacterium oceani TaxID=2654998 RepID=A0A6N7EY96_9GAMM|nr:dihydrofolate reductase [Ostreibacterium oceani]MPV86097.1 dihydrofolate reductase [Ostreibacterium oceani]
MSNNTTKTQNPITLIVAASTNDIIGRDNQLPWHLPRDLAYFKAITTGCPIIMGRKTYESIGKALPNRLNIVITRNPDYQLPDAEVTLSVSDAIAIAQKWLDNQANNNDGSDKNCQSEIHIIGGAAIFAEALPLVDKIYLNRVLADFDGDTYLPAIDWTQFKQTASTHHAADDKNAYAMAFEVYERTKS